MNKKAAGVMTALKGRKGFGAKKKGGMLLGIVAKLSAKRKAAGEKKADGAGGCGKK